MKGIIIPEADFLRAFDIIEKKKFVVKAVIKNANKAQKLSGSDWKHFYLISDIYFCKLGPFWLLALARRGVALILIFLIAPLTCFQSY